MILDSLAWFIVSGVGLAMLVGSVMALRQLDREALLAMGVSIVMLSAFIWAMVRLG